MTDDHAFQIVHKLSKGYELTSEERVELFNAWVGLNQENFLLKKKITQVVNLLKEIGS